MKTKLTSLLTFCLIVFALSSAAQETHSLQQHEGEHKMLNHNELQWQEGPASLPKGIKLAILEGDMTKAGPFTVRIQLPANYKIPPHWHPAIEHITVLEGSFYMGSGEKYDTGKATKLAKGGFGVMPIKYVHFAFTTEAAIIQLHGIGPWGITYINEADDPRKQVK